MINMTQYPFMYYISGNKSSMGPIKEPIDREYPDEELVISFLVQPLIVTDEAEKMPKRGNKGSRQVCQDVSLDPKILF